MTQFQAGALTWLQDGPQYSAGCWLVAQLGFIGGCSGLMHSLLYQLLVSHNQVFLLSPMELPHLQLHSPWGEGLVVEALQCLACWLVGRPSWTSLPQLLKLQIGRASCRERV